MGSSITSGECSLQDTVNITNETVPEWSYTPTHTLFVTIIVPVFWGIGVITNSTFLFVLLRLSKMRSKSYILLAHLALADLWQVSFYCMVYLWMYLASPVAFSLPFWNSAGCVTFYAAFNVGYFASVALITMVSWERYVALCHPMKHLEIRSQRQTYKMVGICWLAGFLFSCAIVPGTSIFSVRCLHWPDDNMYEAFPSVHASCGPVHPWVGYYVEPLVLIPWLVLVIANIYMFVQIVRALDKRKDITNTTASASETPSRILQIRNQFAIMLIVNGVVFFICQTPIRLVNLSNWISLVAGLPDNPFVAALGGNYVVWIVLLPQLTNCFVNPLIYGATNANYRAALYQAFRCRQRSRQAAHSQSSCAVTASTSYDNTVDAQHDSQTDTPL